MIEVNSKEVLDNTIIENSDKLIMLLFSTSWCSPCKKLKERLKSDETINQLPNLFVIYIDAETENEELQELIDKYKITAIPTQVFVKLNDNKLKIIDIINGSDWIKLLMIYNDYFKNIEN